MNIARILHPTDFTKSAGPAFDRALALTRHYGAELHLLHVTETLGSDPIRGAFDARLDEDTFYRDLSKTADGKLEELAALVQGRGVKLRCVQLRGQKPAPVILEYARDERADLIVMGTHGRRGFRRMVAGSVAMEVVRKAEVPVLTVGPSVTGAEGRYFDRILVPVDFSEHAKTALGMARALAADLDSELIALHVIEKPSFPAFYEASVDMFYGSMQNMENEARMELRRMSGEVDDLIVETTFEVRVGHAVDTILRAAREFGASLIVLSTHGATGIPRFFLGSVSERIIRSAEFPVLRLKTLTHDDSAVDLQGATKSG